MHVCMYACMYVCCLYVWYTHNRTYCIGTLRLTFAREELTTKFPVALGSAKALGISDSSFTVMAWVYSDASVSDATKSDYAILGTDTNKKNEGLHLLV